ncbi:MAG: hypothetical protein P4L77_12145 [Sulfuriferula sp.]|nr:hypothetical protein [Sulfuriferula sp.]
MANKMEKPTLIEELMPLLQLMRNAKGEKDKLRLAADILAAAGLLHNIPKSKSDWIEDRPTNQI